MDIYNETSNNTDLDGILAQIKEKTENVYNLNFPETPDSDLKNTSYPSVITDMTSSQLSNLITRYSKLASYAEVLVSIYDVQRTKFGILIGTVEAEVKAMTSGQATHKKAMAQVETKQLRIDAFQAELNYKITSALLKGYDRCLSNLSRELTRRLNELTKLPG